MDPFVHLANRLEPCRVIRRFDQRLEQTTQFAQYCRKAACEFISDFSLENSILVCVGMLFLPNRLDIAVLGRWVFRGQRMGWGCAIGRKRAADYIQELLG